MSSNIFIDQPEFIDNDPRVHRPKISGTAVSAESMHVKQSILLPPKLIHNKRVLDLGSCNAASGAWVLSHGAAFYRGIEFQEEFVNSSREALSKYYPKDKWSIIQGSIEDFLDSNEEKYDLVIASGVLHVFPDPLRIVKQIMNIGKSIVIESSHPSTFQNTPFMNDALKKIILNAKDYIKYIENEPFMQLGIEGMTVPGEQTLLFEGVRPSMGVFKQLMKKEGFTYIDAMNQKLKQFMPKTYTPYGRFGILFVRHKVLESGEYGFLDAVKGNAANKVYKWD